MSALPLARLFGFEIRIHVSWAIILAVIAVTVVSEVATIAPDSDPIVRWIVGGVVAGAFLLSALAHELGHAIASRRGGAPGRVLVVYFFGGAASPNLETRSPRAEIVAALAGPVVSLVIGGALVAVAAAGGVVGGDLSRALGQIALVVGILNLVLGGVNLLPAFPLDGGRVVRAIAWWRTGDATSGLRTSARIGRWLGIGLGVLGVGLILRMDSVDGLMLALCGWFIVSSARALERSASLEDLLRGVLVEDAMDTDITGVPATMTLDTFAAQVLDTPGGTVPVTDGHALVGVLGARDIRRIRRADWPSTRAGDLMRTTEALPEVAPSTSLRAARDLLERSGLDGLPVMDAGRLAGIVTRRGVAKAIHDRAIRAGAAGPA